MKKLFFHKLKKTLQEIFSKNIFVVKRMKKEFPVNIAVDKHLFVRLRINIQ